MLPFMDLSQALLPKVKSECSLNKEGHNSHNLGIYIHELMQQQLCE